MNIQKLKIGDKVKQNTLAVFDMDNEELQRNKMTPEEEKRLLTMKIKNKQDEDNRIRELENEHLKEIARQKNVEDNPLRFVEARLYNNLLQPNREKYDDKDKPFYPCNISPIKENFQDALKYLTADNGLRYIDSPVGLLEVVPENEYNQLCKWYNLLMEVTKLIVPISALTNPKEVGTILTNRCIVKFLDGIYDLSTFNGVECVKLENLELNKIPCCKSSVHFFYSPTQADLDQTKAILKHIFVEPVELVKHLKDIMFNDCNTKLKQFTLIHGISNSGKTTIKRVIFGKLFNDKAVNISNFINDKERTSLTGYCKTVSVEEVQERLLDGTFLNEYSGETTIHINEKYSKKGRNISTKHCIFIGEEVPYLSHSSMGTYNRLFTIETHNQLPDLKQELLDYMNSQNFIDTLFYFIKKVWIRDNSVFIKNINAGQYNNMKSDLYSVLSRYIEPDATEIDNITKYNSVLIDKYTGDITTVPDYDKGFRLNREALKQLLVQLQARGELAKKYDIDKMDIKIINTLKQIIIDYDKDNKKNIRYKGRQVKYDFNICPKFEAIDILRASNFSIDSINFIVTNN